MNYVAEFSSILDLKQMYLKIFAGKLGRKREQLFLFLRQFVRMSFGNSPETFRRLIGNYSSDQSLNLIFLLSWWILFCFLRLWKKNCIS